MDVWNFWNSEDGRTDGRTDSRPPPPVVIRKEGRETGSNCRRRRGGGTRKAEKLFPCLASFPLSALKMWNLIRGHPSDEDNTASDRAFIFSAQFQLCCAPCGLTISEGKSAGRERRDRYPMGKLYGWRGREGGREGGGCKNGEKSRRRR